MEPQKGRSVYASAAGLDRGEGLHKSLSSWMQPFWFLLERSRIKTQVTATVEPIEIHIESHPVVMSGRSPKSFSTWASQKALDVREFCCLDGETSFLQPAMKDVQKSPT